MSTTEEELQELYVWVDQIQFSRPKRNIARDFSDGVLLVRIPTIFHHTHFTLFAYYCSENLRVSTLTLYFQAELLAHFYPKLVEIHNYSAANSFSQKMYNWNTLCSKVLKRLGVTLDPSDVDRTCKVVPGAIENILRIVRKKVEHDRAKQVNQSPSAPPSRSAAPAVHPSNRQNIPSTAPSSNQGVKGLTPRFANASRAATANSPSRAPNHGVFASGDGDGSPGKYQAFAAVQHFDHSDLAMQREVDTEILVEKEQALQELRETNEILETKVKKLEQLLRLKDSKIQALVAKVQSLEAR